MIEEGPVQKLQLRDRIVGILAAITRALVMIAMFHYLWLSLGNSLYARMVSTNTNGQPKTFGGITSTEQGSALMAGPTAGRQAHCNNASVKVLVDSGTPEHYFDDAIIPRLRGRLQGLGYKKISILQGTRRCTWVGAIAWH